MAAAAEMDISLFEVDVLRWNVKPEASQLFGGMIGLTLSHSNSISQYFEWLNEKSKSGQKKVVFFPKSSLKNLNNSDTTTQLLCSALRQFTVLSRCNGVETLAGLISAYLCCKYRFSQKILSGLGTLKPLIHINLLVVFKEAGIGKFKETVSKFAGNSGRDLIFRGRDSDIVRGVLKKCYGGGGEEFVTDLEGVEEGLEMKHVTIDEDENEEMTCAVCLERFVKYQYAARTSCSHVFHQGCIIGWLLRQDSCPMCRSSCSICV